MSDEGRLIADRYCVLDRIGRGGMGTVWRAHDTLLGRQVAVKKLHPQPHLSADELATLFERTRREARSAARISHPNVVVVHDVVDDEGLLAIVMEYVPSTTLADLIEAHGPVPPAEAARIGLGVLAALRAAHRAGVLHRDVKPANVLLAEDDRVVLTDFGIAQASDTSTLTVTGQLVGSVDFIAPERLAGGRQGPESDLWALGATLFQAVEGRSPFRRDTVTETMYAIAMGPMPEIRRAGPLTPVIQGLLANRPDERPSAEEAERLLRTAAAEGHSSGAAPAAPAVSDVRAESGLPGVRAVPAEPAVPGVPAEPAVPGALVESAVPGGIAVPGGTPEAREPTPTPDHGNREASAAGAPPDRPPTTSAGRRARPRPGRWMKKPVVLGTAAAAVVLIAVPLLVTLTPDKGSTSTAASDRTPVADDRTVPGIPGTSTSPTPSPVSSLSGSPSSAATPRAPASSPSPSELAAEDTEASPGSEDTPTKSGSGSPAATTGRALVVAASQKCLSRGDGTEGIQLFQDTCDGSAAQQWQLGSGTVRSSGKCMTVAGGATADRTAIQLAGCDGGGSQRFRLDGTELVAEQSQKCVDIFGGASGTDAVLWECNGRDNQIWTLG
ncbi:serine/threonine protein kinase [Streptomyces sp. V4I2]|uniref:serine/threonine protein kinase n=1 Tax=Streptomyces sp. V4I2 TaxID=3042280 RepID=UPI0027877390|nr:serine/threonine protein kinase [Streptomyces sp. V4I2]MDQ1048183.1 tRNA A-37 threonylcarbamoyl transferase component Bud32 [Streptomyces sp. V4I2]